MATIPSLLLNYFDELGSEDFKNFKYQLEKGVSKGFDPIARSKLERAERRHDLVRLMVNQYGDPEVGDIVVKVLEQIQQNDLAEKLKKELAQGQRNTDETDSRGPSSASNVGTSGITVNASGNATAPVFSGSTFQGPTTFNFKR